MTRRTKSGVPPGSPRAGKGGRAGKAVRVRSVPVPAENSIVPAEGLREAESELGINEWPDPETGEPAEGQSPPHLDEE